MSIAPGEELIGRRDSFLCGFGIAGVHRDLDPIEKQRLDAVRATLECHLQKVGILGSEILKHEIRGIHSSRWSTDADAHARESVRIKGVDNGRHTFMPAGAAFGANANSPKRQIEIVVNHD